MLQGIRNRRGSNSRLDQSRGARRRASRLQTAIAPCVEQIEPRRMLSAGAPDPTFGTLGLVNDEVVSGANSFGQAVAIQADGKILVAGYSSLSQVDFTLVRYNANGTLDSSFGTSGAASASFGSSMALGTSIAIQSDNKIIVAGYASSADIGGNLDFALARFNADGSLDGTFSSDGKVTTDFAGSDDLANSVAVQADGKIVVAGTTFTGNDVAIARYNSDGTLDNSFDTDGLVTTDFHGSLDGGNSVAIQADGRIVVGGFAFDLDYNLAVARYNTDGALDGSFSGDGRATVDFAGFEDSAYGVAIQADGKIVAAGYSYDALGEPNFALARFNADGTTDSGFGSGGKTVTDFVGTESVGRSVALQADGKIVVAGYANASGYNFALARYAADGTLDPTFGSAGQLTTDFSLSDDQGMGVAVQADGKIVAAGLAFNSTLGAFSFGVVRYEGDPAPTNDPPVADVGGPYAIVEGGALSLDASGSSDPDFDLITFAWDLDNDGSFDDAAGVAPVVSWTALQNLLASDDGTLGATFPVAVQVDDGQGNLSVATASVALGNTAPTALLTAGAAVVQGSASTVTFSGAADPSIVDTNAGLTYSFDFNNDGDFADAGEVANSTNASASFTYASDGNYPVRGRVSDKDGGFTDYTVTVEVQPPPPPPPPPPVSVAVDPTNPNFSVLIINGTNQADTILVLAGANGSLQGSFGGNTSVSAQGPLANKPFSKVIVNAGGGNDSVTVLSLTLQVIVFGGPGNDTVQSGFGRDILVGGEGNDRLYGGPGNDLLIGSSGADSLRGDLGNDVLIGGSTDYDADLATLVSLSNETTAYSTSWMHDDASRDTLTGSFGVDRFFANQADGLINDLITDQSNSETTTDLP